MALAREMHKPGVPGCVLRVCVIERYHLEPPRTRWAAFRGLETETPKSIIVFRPAHPELYPEVCAREIATNVCVSVLVCPLGGWEVFRLMCAHLRHHAVVAGVVADVPMCVCVSYRLVSRNIRARRQQQQEAPTIDLR